MNTVIAGDRKGNSVIFSPRGEPQIGTFFKVLKISKKTVEACEVLNETIQTSTASAVGRATLGSFFLGPAGAAAALGAKRKGVYWVAIQFKDGKRSLLEVDDKLFRAITIALF